MPPCFSSALASAAPPASTHGLPRKGAAASVPATSDARRFGLRGADGALLLKCFFNAHCYERARVERALDDVEAFLRALAAAAAAQQALAAAAPLALTLNSSPAGILCRGSSLAPQLGYQCEYT